MPVITKKTLQIDLAQAPSASALTLMTTDIETIDGGIRFMHELWAALLEIGLGSYLLYRQIGQAMGIPLGTVFCKPPLPLQLVGFPTNIDWILT